MTWRGHFMPLAALTAALVVGCASRPPEAPPPVVAAPAAPQTVQAAQQDQYRACGERAAVLERLAIKYREGRTAAGVNSEGYLIEVFRTLDGSTWTILITFPNGITCMVAAGEGWRAFEPAVFGTRV